MPAKTIDNRLVEQGKIALDNINSDVLNFSEASKINNQKNLNKFFEKIINDENIIEELVDAGINFENIASSFIENEKAHKDPSDYLQDLIAKYDLPKFLGKNPTLGSAQISPEALREFREKYAELNKYVESKGYDYAENEIALIDD
jgi:hypothetical protein